MKKIAENGGIRIPRHVHLDKKLLQEDKSKYKKFLEEKIGYPMFLKQIAGTSSKGSSKARNEEELDKALDICLKYNSEYEVDEYIDARVIAIDYMFVNGKLVFFRATDYFFPYGETLNGKPFAPWNYLPSDPFYQRLLKMAYKIEKTF